MDMTEDTFEVIRFINVQYVFAKLRKYHWNDWNNVESEAFSNRWFDYLH